MPTRSANHSPADFKCVVWAQGDKPDAFPIRLDQLEYAQKLYPNLRKFDSALTMYRQQKFEEAKTIFVELESSIQDPVSAVFAGRCDEFMVRHTARAFLGFCGWLLTDVCLCICTGGPAGAKLGRGLPAQVEVNMNGRRAPPI